MHAHTDTLLLFVYLTTVNDIVYLVFVLQSSVGSNLCLLSMY